MGDIHSGYHLMSQNEGLAIQGSTEMNLQVW